jgi:precorrin-2 dehydrogenase/sirohydrochlorin ferrochelatase
MPLFPAFIDLKDKKVLVVGGGKVATRKVQKLLPFGAKIEVVSPRLTKELQELFLAGRISWKKRKFLIKDLRSAYMVVVAVDSIELQRMVFNYCSKRKILCNAVDSPDYCNFIFPALVHKGDVVIGISTSGKVPALSALLREKIEECIPKDVDKLLEQAYRLRSLYEEGKEKAEGLKGIFREKDGRMRYRVSLKLWEMNEMEDMEYEESEQFAGFEEDPTDAYRGYVPEEFTIAFVDGIRRIDHSAYVWDESKNSSYEAVFATLSAGAIILKPKSINLIEQSFRMQRVRRVFLVKGDIEETAFSGLGYEVKKLLEDKELSLELLRLLRREEVDTAREVWKKVKPQLLVCDGTLTSEHRGITCVGFVKTIKRLFISKEHAPPSSEPKKGLPHTSYKGALPKKDRRTGKA